MAFPLLKLLPSILKGVAKVTGLDIVGQAADALGSAQLSPEQEVALQESLQRHEAAMKALSVDELKAALTSAQAESTALLTSEDVFVRRARPTMLYAATGITVMLCGAVGLTITRGGPIDLGAVGAITSLMVPLWGASGYYIGQRTREKLNGGNHS